jgi:polyisoprenoid-binding protein YceI
MLKYLFCYFGLLATMGLNAQQRFLTEKGRIYFRSDAPLEIIEAESSELKGVIDNGQKTFAFSVNMSSFKGFNSPLQREHFNENYMETNIYPKATFNGRIIEDVDLSKDGTYEIRAKGKLNIHGIEQERIIKSTVIVKNGSFAVNADFTVLLEEHGISIPKIVYQKIAGEIKVNIQANFVKA